MAFYGQNFIYNGKNSEMYGLQIANTAGGTSAEGASGAVSFIESFIYRKPKPYFYGVTYTDKLRFPITVYSEDEINAVDASAIQFWLFGKLTYARLAIVQPDMSNFYFNCILTNHKTLRVGNVIYGFEAEVVCDSPFAYTYPKTITYPNPSGSAIVFNNQSHYPGYLYPTVSFTIPVDSARGDFSITNADDDDREFLFEDVASETVTVDNERGIVTSSTGRLLLSHFNKNFLRLVPGLNHLTIGDTYATTMSITYQFMKRVGA